MTEREKLFGVDCGNSAHEMWGKVETSSCRDAIMVYRQCLSSEDLTLTGWRECAWKYTALMSALLQHLQGVEASEISAQNVPSESTPRGMPSQAKVYRMLLLLQHNL